MKRLYTWPYNSFSASARELSYLRIKRRGSRFRYNASRKLVINWGSKDCPYPCLNSNEAVSQAVDKRRAFRVMTANEVSVPPWTTDKAVAQAWNKKTVVRHKVASYEGRGIEIVPAGQRLPDAPLYVQYKRKSSEYRIHVVSGVIIDEQKKVLSQEARSRGNTNFTIRNSASGFIFQRTGIVVPDMVKREALKAVHSLSLDFGAVDVVWSERHQTAYVLEVNTAPGIEGTTVLKYREAFNAIARVR